MSKSKIILSTTSLVVLMSLSVYAGGVDDGGDIQKPSSSTAPAENLTAPEEEPSEIDLLKQKIKEEEKRNAQLKEKKELEKKLKALQLENAQLENPPEESAHEPQTLEEAWGINLQKAPDPEFKLTGEGINKFLFGEENINPEKSNWVNFKKNLL